MSRIYFIVFLLSVYLVMDLYVFSVVRSLTAESTIAWKRTIWIAYWTFSTVCLVGVLLYNQLDPHIFKGLRLFITSFFFINLVAKVFSTLVIFGDDLRRGISYLSQFFYAPAPERVPGRRGRLTTILPPFRRLCPGREDHRVCPGTSPIRAGPMALSGDEPAQHG